MNVPTFRPTCLVLLPRMTDDKTLSSPPAIDFAQLIAALQSMGIKVGSPPRKIAIPLSVLLTNVSADAVDHVPQPATPSSTLPTFSARICL